MASESLLESVARHETSLMADLERAREEARDVVETAHAESATLLQESSATLDSELGEMRKKAAKSREDERVAIEKATTEEVERIRTESAGRMDGVRKDLIARILPSAQ